MKWRKMGCPTPIIGIAFVSRRRSLGTWAYHNCSDEYNCHKGWDWDELNWATGNCQMTSRHCSVWIAATILFPNRCGCCNILAMSTGLVCSCPQTPILQYTFSVGNLEPKIKKSSRSPWIHMPTPHFGVPAAMDVDYCILQSILIFWFFFFVCVWGGVGGGGGGGKISLDELHPWTQALLEYWNSRSHNLHAHIKFPHSNSNSTFVIQQQIIKRQLIILLFPLHCSYQLVRGQTQCLCYKSNYGQTLQTSIVRCLGKKPSPYLKYGGGTVLL